MIASLKVLLQTGSYTSTMEVDFIGWKRFNKVKRAINRDTRPGIKVIGYTTILKEYEY